MDAELQRYYKTVVDSIKLLSLPYRKQKEFLPDFVDHRFEIMDSFQHAFVLLPQLVENKIIPTKALADILRLKNMVDLTINMESLYDLSDKKLEKNEYWVSTQSLAIKILPLLGENYDNEELWV